MKKYIKVYAFSVLIAGGCALLPWFLGTTLFLSMLDVLEITAFLGAVCGLLISFLYICKNAESRKIRIILLICNPVVYYVIGLLVIMILLSGTKLYGWGGLAP